MFVECARADLFSTKSLFARFATACLLRRPIDGSAEPGCTSSRYREARHSCRRLGPASAPPGWHCRWRPPLTKRRCCSRRRVVSLGGVDLDLGRLEDDLVRRPAGPPRRAALRAAPRQRSRAARLAPRRPARPSESIKRRKTCPDSRWSRSASHNDEAADSLGCPGPPISRDRRSFPDGVGGCGCAEEGVLNSGHQRAPGDQPR